MRMQPELAELLPQSGAPPLKKDLGGMQGVVSGPAGRGMGNGADSFVGSYQMDEVQYQSLFPTSS